MSKACPGAATYYRQIDGKGEAIRHCSICHKPVDLHFGKRRKK